MFLYVGVTEGTHTCINSSVPPNAYLCGIKANGLGFNTAGIDKCQCSLEFKIGFICKYPLLQNHSRNVFPVSRTGPGCRAGSLLMDLVQNYIYCPSWPCSPHETQHRAGKAQHKPRAAPAPSSSECRGMWVMPGGLRH